MAQALKFEGLSEVIEGIAQPYGKKIRTGFCF